MKSQTKKDVFTFQAVVETTPPSIERRPPSPADFTEDPVSPPPLLPESHSEFHRGQSAPLPDVHRVPHPTALPVLHHPTAIPEPVPVTPVHLAHPTHAPVTPVHLAHPTHAPVTPVHLAHTTPAPIHLPHPSIAAAHLVDPEPLPYHPTPIPHHPTPVTPVHLPAAVSVTPLPDIFNQIPGINPDQLTEADLLLADPATHTHPLGTHPLLPIHPGHDIPHSHPPFDQHPVIDVASGAVLSNLDDHPIPEVAQPLHEVHHAGKQRPQSMDAKGAVT